MRTTGAAGKDGPGRGHHNDTNTPHVGGPERPWARRLPLWSDPSVRRQECRSRGRTWRRPAAACRSWRKPLVAPPACRIQRRTSRRQPWQFRNRRRCRQPLSPGQVPLGRRLGPCPSGWRLSRRIHRRYPSRPEPPAGLWPLPPPRTWVSPHRRSRSRRAPALEAHDTSDEGRRIAVRASLAALSVGVACVEWR